jgi:hypothetical protein
MFVTSGASGNTRSWLSQFRRQRLAINDQPVDALLACSLGILAASADVCAINKCRKVKQGKTV